MDNYHETALHMAARSGHFEPRQHSAWPFGSEDICDVLLDAGADPRDA